MKKQRIGVFNAVNSTLLILIALICVYPFLYVFFVSVTNGTFQTPTLNTPTINDPVIDGGTITNAEVAGGYFHLTGTLPNAYFESIVSGPTLSGLLVMERANLVAGVNRLR